MRGCNMKSFWEKDFVIIVGTITIFFVILPLSMYLIGYLLNFLGCS